jgi:hypothetical protein
MPEGYITVVTSILNDGGREAFVKEWEKYFPPITVDDIVVLSNYEMRFTKKDFKKNSSTLTLFEDHIKKLFPEVQGLIGYQVRDPEKRVDRIKGKKIASATIVKVAWK